MADGWRILLARLFARAGGVFFAAMSDVSVAGQSHGFACTGRTIFAEQVV
jgi:hypothetical protein